MFSTLMSLEDRLRLKLKVKTNAGPPMAIPIYTVVGAVLVSQYGSIVYIGICHGWSSIIAIHKEIVLCDIRWLK